MPIILRKFVRFRNNILRIDWNSTEKKNNYSKELMSNRPRFIKDSDIARWNQNIENDPKITKFMLDSSVLREVMYSGLYLAEQLDNLNCPFHQITQIQFTAGRMSFGRNPWDITQLLIQEYKDGKLIFE